MEQFARENGIRPKPIDDDVHRRRSSSRKWPGNVRELKNAVERSAILCAATASPSPTCPEDPHASPFEEESDAADGRRRRPSTRWRTTPPATPRAATRPRAPGAKHLTLREFREKSERQYIVDTLQMTGWNISRTAILLGVERTNLHKKIRAYQIKRGEG